MLFIYLKIRYFSPATNNFVLFSFIFLLFDRFPSAVLWRVETDVETRRRICSLITPAGCVRHTHMSAVPCNTMPCTAAAMLIQQCVLEHMNRDARLMRRTRARWYLHYSMIMGGNGEKPIERGFRAGKGYDFQSASLERADDNDSPGCAERSTLLGTMREIVSDHGTWKSRGDSARFPSALYHQKFPFVPYGRISLPLSPSGRVFVWSADCNFYRDASGPASRFVRGFQRDWNDVMKTRYVIEFITR